VALCGLGAIGTEILKRLIERSHEIVAVVDSDPEKAGRSVAEVTGSALGIRIQPSIEGVKPDDTDVVVFSTRSRLSEVSNAHIIALSLGKQLKADKVKESVY